MMQILVNHFNEEEFVVKRFLSSLNAQGDVTFEVLLCSDGGKLKQEWLEGYKFPIKVAHLPHSGVCHTRNVLLDESSSEYVMFCDIDDCFSDPKGLYYLMDVAEETHADVIGSTYLLENKKQSDFEYVPVKKDTIRVHAKAFRREFLLKNNIRFPDEMESSGDMMFLWLVYALAEKKAWVDKPFYIWKWNPNSVTAHTPFKIASLMPNTLKCYTFLAEDLIRRRRKDLLDDLIATTFAMIYVETTDRKWRWLSKDDRIEAFKAIRKYAERFSRYYKSLSENLRFAKYNLMKDYKKYDPAPFSEMMEWVDGLLKDNVLIVGHGVVGTNLEREFHCLKPDIYDKFKGEDTRNSHCYHIAFICVDTPYIDEERCDTTQVLNAITENDADIYVIKSTVLPGTTDWLREETGKRIVFSPEYYGATQHCNNFEFGFTILGGEKRDCVEVVQTLQEVYDARHEFRIVDSKTAELAKYMENAYLATKVSFCCQFFDIAEQIGVSYEELRELFVLDPRVNPSHTFVYRDHPYWKSHCLDKDVRAIAEEYDAEFLKALVDFNGKRLTS